MKNVAFLNIILENAKIVWKNAQFHFNIVTFLLYNAKHNF